MYAVCMRGHLKPGVYCTFNYPGGQRDMAEMSTYSTKERAMEAVTYTCDECKYPIDGKSGPEGAMGQALMLDMVELTATCAYNNPMPEPRHYHRYCFRIVHDRIIAFGRKL